MLSSCITLPLWIPRIRNFFGSGINFVDTNVGPKEQSVNALCDHQPKHQLTDGTCRVEPFRIVPLTLCKLTRSTGHIIGRRIAEYVVHSIGFRNVFTSLANNDRKLCLVITAVIQLGDFGNDGRCRPRIGQRSIGFQKEGRNFWVLHFGFVGVGFVLSDISLLSSGSMMASGRPSQMLGATSDIELTFRPRHLIVPTSPWVKGDSTFSIEAVLSVGSPALKTLLPSKTVTETSFPSYKAFPTSTLSSSGCPTKIAEESDLGTKRTSPGTRRKDETTESRTKVIFETYV